MQNYRQPRYFNDFRCVGGTCTNSCCIGWDIDWTRDEIDKVKNAPKCSEELRALLESSFRPSPKDIMNKFIILFDEDNRCPFLAEDNFCRIQRELGAKYLSHTCSGFPRKNIVTQKECYRFCSMCCPEVINALLNDEKSTELIIDLSKKTNIKLPGGVVSGVSAEHPEQKYRGSLLNLFYEIISDRKNSLETNIVLGALAANSISKLVEGGEYNKIPETIEKIKPQLQDGAQIETIDNIKPNYSVKLGMAEKLLQHIPNFNITSAFADETGTLNIDLYNQGETFLAKAFKDRPWYLRNIALNLLLELAVPFMLPEKSIYENYAIFVISFALIKFAAIAQAMFNARTDAAHLENDDMDDNFIEVVSSIVRQLANNPTRLGLLLENIKNMNMFSTAYLALFVK